MTQEVCANCGRELTDEYVLNANGKTFCSEECFTAYPRGDGIKLRFALISVRDMFEMFVYPHEGPKHERRIEALTSLHIFVKPDETPLHAWLRTTAEDNNLPVTWPPHKEVQRAALGSVETKMWMIWLIEDEDFNFLRTEWGAQPDDETPKHLICRYCGVRLPDKPLPMSLQDVGFCSEECLEKMRAENGESVTGVNSIDVELDAPNIPLGLARAKYALDDRGEADRWVRQALRGHGYTEDAGTPLQWWFADMARKNDLPVMWPPHPILMSAVIENKEALRPWLLFIAEQEDLDSLAKILKEADSDDLLSL